MSRFNRLALCCVLAAVLFAAPALALRTQVSPDQRTVETFVSTLMPRFNVPWNKANPFDSPPVCTWSGVTCNSGLNVTGLNFTMMGLSGTLDLTKLPPHLQLLNLSSNTFMNPVDLTALPPTLRKLDLSMCMLPGPIDLTQLPKALKVLDLHINMLTGFANLTVLPVGLEQLNLHLNMMKGPVNLTALPSSLVTLNLADNDYNGTLNLMALPPSLRSFVGHNNDFGGAVNLTALPSSLATLNLLDNSAICGSSKLPAGHANLVVKMPSQCTAVVASKVWKCPTCPPPS